MAAALGIGLAPGMALSNPSTTFFIVAHEDDWQLFMGINSWYDVRALDIGIDNKVVFIHTTAGDAGLGTGDKGRPKPYYKAREEGANRAIQFLANIGDAGTKPEGQHVRLNGKNLYRTRYKNTVAYYFRLPDGNMNGNGFPGTGNQSLKRLHENQIATITSIDGKLAFRGWGDFVNTLKTIILFEAEEAANVWANTQDPDSTINPGDHPDHTQTALATQEAISTLSCVNQALFKAYAIKQEPINLGRQDQWKHAALWGVTTSGISDSFHTSTWEPNHNAWLGRQYHRVIQGNAPCAFKQAK